MPPFWPSRSFQESRPFTTLKEGKVTTNNNRDHTKDLPDWEVRLNNYWDTIAYLATGRAYPSTREERVTGGEEKLIKGDIDYTISHRTKLEGLNKDVMTDGLDGVVKKVNSCT
jgi:hypothetical protein